MTTKSGTVSITIPEDQWDESGYDNDPRGHLITMIKIGGCYMHLEAFAVKERKRTDGSIAQDFGDWEDSHEAEAIMRSADYEPTHTITIKGREYALIATPYQK